MADVKWIKLTTDMFDNRKIRYLRRLPDGNNIVLIWIMLLTMAGRCNANGMIFLTENIPYTPKILADELGFEENTVILALKALEQLDMIVANNGLFSISGWEEYQNVDGMGKIREQNRIRQANFKQRQKLLKGNVTDNVTVTEGNATDIDKDIDKDKDKKESEKLVTTFNTEKAWTDTFELYPKKSAAVMAKQIWMNKLLDVVEPNRKAVAKLIYHATKEYLVDYEKKNPNDECYRYVPKFGDWLTNDCDYWISVVEKKQRGDGS